MQTRLVKEQARIFRSRGQLAIHRVERSAPFELGRGQLAGLRVRLADEVSLGNLDPRVLHKFTRERLNKSQRFGWFSLSQPELGHESDGKIVVNEIGGELRQQSLGFLLI